MVQSLSLSSSSSVGRINALINQSRSNRRLTVGSLIVSVVVRM